MIGTPLNLEGDLARFNLAFFQELFSRGSKIYCYASFYYYANFSVVFAPNFRGGGKFLRGRGNLLDGDTLCGRKPVVMYTLTPFREIFSCYLDHYHFQLIINVTARDNPPSWLRTHHNGPVSIVVA